MMATMGTAKQGADDTVERRGRENREKNPERMHPDGVAGDPRYQDVAFELLGYQETDRRL